MRWDAVGGRRQGIKEIVSFARPIHRIRSVGCSLINILNRRSRVELFYCTISNESNGDDDVDDDLI